MLDNPSFLSQTIHENFEAQVKRTPDAIAVRFKDKTLTYRALNEYADNLATYLIKNYCTGKNSFIGLYLERSEWLLVAILAVLKTGSAYVPIEPNYPIKRILHIVHDTRINVVLTENHLISDMQDISDVDCILVDECKNNTGNNSQADNRGLIYSETDLAYVIYTSGTTGIPKGVAIEHSSFLHLLVAFKKLYFKKLKSLNTYSITNYTFDIFGMEYGLPLLTGGTVVLDNGHKDISAINFQELSFFQLTPSLCSALLDSIPNKLAAKLIIGGEQLHIELLRKLLEKKIDVIHVYGPTETTIWSASRYYHHTEMDVLGLVGLGEALPGESLYVLNEDLTIADTGDTGELCIGGYGLAREYLNQPLLTNERFIANPFQTAEDKKHNINARLYKTGDLVRYRADGELEFLGRNDSQIKIRGHRIEINEIEKAFTAYPDIKQVTVLLKHNAETQYLVGYYVAYKPFDENALHKHLKKHIPEHMIPDILVHLPSFPLTANGKLDRNALPEPIFSTKNTYEAPRNLLEKQICIIWQDVLGIEKIGIHDDFFGLGGTSILAIQIVNRILRELDIQTNFICFLQNSTVEKFVSKLTDFPENSIFAIVPNNQDKAYPLSFAQQRLLFIDKFEDRTNAYNIHLVYQIPSNIELKLLENAFKHIIERHEILKTIINIDEDGHPYQEIIHTHTENFTLAFKDTANDAELKNFMKLDAAYHFDLTNDCMLRAVVYHCDEKCYLSTVIHHIAFDGWSEHILLNELYDFYQHVQVSKSAQDCKLPQLDIQYKDFSVWQQRTINNSEIITQLDYWRNSLEDYVPFNFIIDKPRPNTVDYSGQKISFEISLELSVKLRALAKSQKVSLFTVMFTAYYLMLRTYSFQDDIVIGMPVANRHHAQLEYLIGFFVNTLAIRISASESKESISELIQRIGICLSNAQQNQDCPFDTLIDALKLPKDLSRHPIFQIMFGAQNVHTLPNKVGDFFRACDIDELYAVSKFDLSTFFDDTHTQLTGYFNYATSLFESDTIHCLIETYTLILGQIVEKIDFSIDDLGYLSPETYNTLIYKWNNTYKDYSRFVTAHQLFEEQVSKTPHNVAVVCENIELTYEQLNIKANQLAYELQSIYAVTPEKCVGLCLDRSEHVIIAMLAVLKSGGAYVPIDPNYPAERKRYILEDTNASVVIGNQIYQDQTCGLALIPFISIDSRTVIEKLSRNPFINLATSSSANNLAYVMYTSGTTGQPKGVMIEHKNLVNLLCSMKSIYRFDEQDNFMFYRSYVFDASLEETLLPLVNGNKLCIAKDGIRDLEQFFKIYKEHSISIMNLNSEIAEVFNHEEYNKFKLRTVIAGGTNFRLKAFSRFISNGSNVFNTYGPTECTVNTTTALIKNELNNIIGRPMYNATCYVFGKSLNPVPIGAIGELYIGGAGVARGYLNQPTLTNEKFVKNPFLQSSNSFDFKNALMMYKTGDLVRWLPNGCLEYVGRNDTQIKLRGYRIELSEIDSAFLKHKHISYATTILKKNENNSFLISYYIADKNLDPNEVVAFLEKILPAYMIPSAMMQLDELPLTLSGKLDVNALPDVNFEAEKIIVPRDSIEEKIAQIWADILNLNVEKIGIETNFFDLGGNSILAIRFITQLKKHLDFSHCKISDIFKYPSIKAFSDFLSNKDRSIPQSQTLFSNHIETDIAIIGMSGAFANSENTDKYWDNIANGKNCLSYFSLDECRERGVPDDVLNSPNYVPVSGIVDNIEMFDPKFWGFSINDAKLADPQMRKFFEHAWMALEDAGYIKERSTKKIAVFAGMSESEYFIKNMLHDQDLCTEYSWEIQTLNRKDFLATRTSYLLGLTGTSLNINTACSTSLVTIVEACKNLALGTCDIALAGGASFVPGNCGYLYYDKMIHSQDGYCRVFDKEATGIVRSEGVGIVVLKRLSQAIIDDDNILAVISGYATNNDGNQKVGFTAPSIQGQMECILAAQAVASISAQEVGYVECHGTGTALGDPIEISALHDAFEKTAKGRPYDCILGSVKANIGHAYSAAGVASVIKLCYMLKNHVIPPQINFKEINPDIHIEDTQFRVVIEKQEWNIPPEKKRVAAVSAFGIGGTNAHVILREYIKPLETKISSLPPPIMNYYVLPISAKSPQSYQQYCAALAAYLSSENSCDIHNVAYLLQNKREDFHYRGTIVCDNKEGAISKLKNASYSNQTLSTNPPIIFMFPGQGSQYVNMMFELYQKEPNYMHYLDQCFEVITKISNINIKSLLYPSKGLESSIVLQQTQTCQPALFIVSYALAKFLMDLDIQPAGMIGHSIGEFVAATLAGVLTLESAISIVLKRGELMQLMPSGKMLSVNSSPEKMRRYLHSCMTISVYNAPEYCVISGEKEDIDALKKILDKEDVACSVLHVSHAYHSEMMRVASVEFENYLCEFEFSKPHINFISNLSGTFITDEQATSASYWAAQLLKPVKFCQGIITLNQSYNNAVYLEVGPGRALKYFVSQQNIHQTISLVKNANEHKKNASDLEHLYTAIGQLWCYGKNMNWSKEQLTYVDHVKKPRIPFYQFEKIRCWIDHEPSPSTDIVKKDALKIANDGDWIYHATWQTIEKIDRSAIPEYKESSSWLIFQDEQHSLTSLVDSLLENNQHVIVVIASKEPDIVIKEELIFLNPELTSHYVALSNYIKKFDIQNVIHGWQIMPIDSDISYARCQYTGSYSLYMLQSVVFTYLDRKINVAVLINNLNQVSGDDWICENKAPILAAVRTIPHENVFLATCVIDVGDSIESAYLIALLINTDHYYLEPNYSLRYGYLWKQNFESYSVPKNVGLSRVSSLQKNDVILISGGLGQLALAVAKKMSENRSMHFVLLDTQTVEMDVKRLDIINIIKSHDCSVEILQCDVSDSKALSQVLDNVKKMHGKIDAVIHTAVSHNRPLDKAVEGIFDNTSAKISGAHNLYHLLQKERLKFFILFSSLTSIMGDVGKLVYSSENAYLDVLSAKCFRNGNKIMAINWLTWSDSTEVKSGQILNQNIETLRLNRVSEDEGAEVFMQLLHTYQSGQFIVSKINIDDIKEKIFNAPEDEPENQDAHSKEIFLVDEHYTQTEHTVAKIFFNILGNQELSKHDNFFDLGGNSLTAIKLLHKLNKILNVRVSITEIFNKSTIIELSEEIAQMQKIQELNVLEVIDEGIIV
ncbi:MAG: amino acid adenylation domain-containing protein [Legionellaceae bacterium]|nr:amino acid adenylation domain-containing protein [Legionellaceae bacterium]MBP9774274.1 amino acid adenylation domain-containing protein [Legionellaceae bacterium]